MDLLERESALASLESALLESRRGAGRLVIVSGEAGIGKTALIEEFTGRYRRELRVFWGVCDSLFTPRPLGPLHDIAPQIGGSLPDLLASETPRTAVFSSLLSEFRRLPAIVVFEDVHWADEATLDLLRYIGRRIQQTSATLLVSLRDDELGPRHPLRSVLGDLVSSASTRRISLSPLSVHAVRVLVGDFDLDPAVLHRQTGGNPFYVTEVLGNPERRIPANVREAVLARAAQLSPAAYAVLEAAAVIGPRVEPWLLMQVSGVESPGVEECMERGMLLVQGDEMAFRHELARETIVQTISPPRKQILHHMVLDVLAASPAVPKDLPRLAHHAEAAHDHMAVLEFAPAAAAQAASAGAHREAATLYELALRYAENLPPAEQAALLVAFADECNLIDRRLDGLKAREQALAIWRRLGDSLKQGEVLSHLSFLWNGLGKSAQAEGACRQAIEILESQPPSRELAFAYRVRSGLHMLNLEHRQAIEWGERAIALAEWFQDDQLVRAAGIPIGTSWLFLDFEYGRDYLHTLMAEATRAGRETLVAHAYANLSSVASALYRFELADRYTSEGATYALEHGQERFRLYMLAWQVLTLARTGRWVEAVELASQVLDRPGVSLTTRLTALVGLGSVHARRGDRAAGAVLDEALNISEGMGSLQRIGLVRAARAEAAWLSGDPPTARREAQAAFELALQKEHPWFAGELAFWLWRCGERVDAGAHLARPFALQIGGDWRAASDEWERLGCPYERARALADGDAQAQIEALGVFEAMGARPDADKLRDKLHDAQVANIPRRPRSSTRENPFGLTGRQVEILELLIEDLTNTEIAGRLHISSKTVEHHVSAVLARLEVATRQAAADLARQHAHFSGK